MWICAFRDESCRGIWDWTHTDGHRKDDNGEVQTPHRRDRTTATSAHAKMLSVRRIGRGRVLERGIVNMVDLIPKEARKTGEGKGSVLVKKGCEIVRWFVSSYSCFFLSFTTSLTVPSQLLFFFLLKLFVQSFLWKAYTYVTRISRFRCLSEAATRIPPSTLTTFAIVTSATASGWLS